MKTSIVFKEWLPDQPENGNPGLIEAKNVVPIDGGYAPFKPILEASLAYGTAPANPVQGGIWARNTAGSAVLYVASQTALSAYYAPNGWTNLSASTYNAGSGDNWDFAQYEDLVIATNPFDRPQSHTAGANASSFTALSTSGEAPYAYRVGVVGQFVVLGQTRQTSTAKYNFDVRWSAIDAPRNWPTPNSQTAIATQSGQQFLHQVDGNVVGIGSNDQHGVIFQEDAITRMTYVGPPVVFQFDRISDQVGCAYPNTIVPLYDKFYFIARSGVCVTDGVSVTNLSDEKVTRWLTSVFYYLDTEYAYGAADPTRNIIMWGFPPRLGPGNSPSFVLIYNYVENRFSWCEQAHRCLLEYGDNNVPEYGRITGFNSSGVPGFFAATAGAAVITTGETEMNPGGRFLVDGIKPNIESTGFAPTVGVRVGYRDALSSGVSYTATTPATSSTGFADFRVDAKYARAEINISGDFEKTSHMVVSGKPSSSR